MSFGAIGGAIGSAVVGSALGGGGGGGGSSQAQTPTPIDISGGGLFDTTGKGQISLTPEMQAIQQQLLGTAGGQGQFQQQAGQLGAGFLGQVGEFDPFAAAQTQFGRMEDILAPQRDQQRLAQESRLFSQGRLGSTGGSQQQQALENVFSQQQAQNLAQALGQAQDIQGQQIERGAFLSQIPQAQQTQALQNLLGIQKGGLSQLQAGLSGGGSTTTTTPPGFDPLGMMGTGLMTSGAEQLGQQLQGAFNQPPALSMGA